MKLFHTRLFASTALAIVSVNCFHMLDTAGLGADDPPQPDLGNLGSGAGSASAAQSDEIGDNMHNDNPDSGIDVDSGDNQQLASDHGETIDKAGATLGDDPGEQPGLTAD